MMVHQFPVFFMIGFLGTFALNILYNGMPLHMLMKTHNFSDVVIGSAIVPISTYLVVLFFIFTWKITVPLLGVLFLLQLLTT
jgi:hypothetical protein